MNGQINLQPLFQERFFNGLKGGENKWLKEKQN